MTYILDKKKLQEALKLLDNITDVLYLKPDIKNSELVCRVKSSGNAAFMKVELDYEWEDDGNEPYDIVVDIKPLMKTIDLSSGDEIKVKLENGWYVFESGKAESKLRPVDPSYLSNKYIDKDPNIDFKYIYEVSVSDIKKLASMYDNMVHITFISDGSKLYGVYQSSTKTQALRLELSEGESEPFIVHMSCDMLKVYLKPMKGNITLGFIGSDMPMMVKKNSVTIVMAPMLVGED